MKRKATRTVVAITIGLALGSLLVLAGCSTVSGFAKDLGGMSEATRKAMSEN